MFPASPAPLKTIECQGVTFRMMETYRDYLEVHYIPELDGCGHLRVSWNCCTKLWDGKWATPVEALAARMPAAIKKAQEGLQLSKLELKRQKEWLQGHERHLAAVRQAAAYLDGLV